MAKGHENLIPPKKGEVRNPNGRPKGALSTKTILLKYLSTEINGKNPFTGKTEEFTLAEVLNLKQIERAMNGDLASYKEIFDRAEGKITTHIDATTNGKELNSQQPLSDELITKLIDKL